MTKSPIELPSSTDRVLIWTDGSCRGNPGPGGAAYVATFNGKTRSAATSVTSQTTNIEMELTAVRDALKSLKRKEIPVTIYCDLKMIVRGMNEWLPGWKARGWKGAQGQEIAHRQLWQEISSLIDEHGAEVRCLSVKAHSGDPGNEEANRLACAASERAVRRAGV